MISIVRQAVGRLKLHQLQPLEAYTQTRLAGHAKWQNVKSQKMSGDMAKGQLISRYVQLVRRAVISGNRQPDPKLNPKLAGVLAEASKLNVPKATIERAIARAMNVKIMQVNIEIQGPGGSALILRCETDNISALRRDIKKIIKKFEANIMTENTIINMFESRGFIRASVKTADQREINEEFAEEAAITANAQEVMLESYPDSKDEELSQAWVFTTDAATLDPCRGELEKQGLKIISSELELIPYRELELDKDSQEKVMELSAALAEVDAVVSVFHNLKK